MAFTNINFQATNCTVTSNTSSQSTRGYIGSIVITANSGYTFNQNANINCEIAAAFVNDSSALTYQYDLPNTYIIWDSNTPNQITIKFLRKYCQVQYTYTNIKITGGAIAESTLHFVNNINNTTENHTINNNIINFEIVGSISNYRFDGIPTITYTDINNVEKTVNCSVTFSNGISTASATLSDANLNSNTFTVNGNYVQYVDIINNINYVDYTYNVYQNDLTLNLIGTKNNYKFTSQPYINYTDINGNETTTYLTLTDNDTKANITVTDCDNTKTISINGVYELFINIINNINNTQITYNYNENTEIIDFVLIGNIRNFRFINNPSITYTDINNVEKTVNFSVEITDNTSIARVSISDGNINSNFIINGLYDKILPVNIITSNCIIRGVNSFVYRDTITNILATANEFCKFTVTPRIDFYNLTLYTHINFSISQDEKTAAANLDMTVFSTQEYDEFDHINILADAIVNTAYLEKYGAINVYVVTNENLTEFSRDRFFILSESNLPRFVDLGEFVPSLKRLFISQNILSPLVPNVLRCGNHNTNIDVLTPINDIIELNCGTVLLPKYNNNITDLNTEINLFLPFVGFVNLNSNLIGKTIEVKYVCNIVTANAVVNIISNEIIIEQYECTICTDLLYRTASSEKTSKAFGKLDFNNNVLKGLTPFVLIKWYSDENQNIINNDCKRNLISTFTGYIECNEIENFVNENITNTEYEILLNSLKNGVIIE